MNNHERNKLSASFTLEEFDKLTDIAKAGVIAAGIYYHLLINNEYNDHFAKDEIDSMIKRLNAREEEYLRKFSGEEYSDGE